MGPAGRGGAPFDSTGPDEHQSTTAGAHRQPLDEVRHSPQPGAASRSTHDRLRGAQLPPAARRGR
eukprot:5602753-Pyramimonas_sp.AAC.1